MTVDIPNTQDHRQSPKDSPSIPAEWTVERHLSGKPDAIVTLYRRFIALVEDCGPFTYSVCKTAITLKGTRRGFVGVKPKERWLDGYLDLQRQVRDRANPHRVAGIQRSYHRGMDIRSPEGWLNLRFDLGSGLHRE